METNKIYHGECIEVLKTFEDDSIDCIVTSPPYWKGFEYEAYFNSYKQYLDWSREWLKECKRGGPIKVFNFSASFSIMPKCSRAY